MITSIKNGYDFGLEKKSYVVGVAHKLTTAKHMEF